MRLAAEPEARSLDPDAWARSRQPGRIARDVLREAAVTAGAGLGLASLAYAAVRSRHAR